MVLMTPLLRIEVAFAAGASPPPGTLLDPATMYRDYPVGAASVRRMRVEQLDLGHPGRAMNTVGPVADIACAAQPSDKGLA